MNMEEFVRILNTHVAAHKPDFGDGESVLALLYEAYAECNIIAVKLYHTTENHGTSFASSMVVLFS